MAKTGLLIKQEDVLQIGKGRVEMGKKSIRIYVALLVVFALIEVGTIISFASQVILSYSKEIQANTNWCWVASARNAVKYSYTPTKTQPEAVMKIKGSLVNETGSLWETASAAKYFSNNTMTYIATARGLTVGVLSYGTLTGKVDAGLVTVLSAGYYNSNGDRIGGHSVSMHGYYTYGSYANLIWYYDPWPSDNSDHECAYSSFLSGGYNGRKYDGTVYAN